MTLSAVRHCRAWPATVAITFLAFAEKTLPWGRPVVRVAAATLVGYGGIVFAVPQVLPTFMASGMSMTASVASASTIVANPNYRLEVIEARSTGPGKTRVTVRLAHVPDNKLVDGAVILDAKTDMGPGGMPEMTGKVSQLPSDQPGLYRFLIETGMAGEWELILSVKVQGETDTVSGATTFDVAT